LRHKKQLLGKGVDLGLESKATAKTGTKRVLGRLHLDSKQLEFSSPGFKWRTTLGADVKAEARKNWLVVGQGRDKIEFDVGKDAARWVEKILNPPDRPKKLGLKTGMKAWVGAGFDSAFKAELKGSGVSTLRDPGKCEIAFCKISHRDELKQIDLLLRKIPDGVNIWLVWPKGVDEIRQADVMHTTAKENFGPSKSAAFDDRFSSMRFARKRTK
jgi:hypothetical protein